MRTSNKKIATKHDREEYPLLFGRTIMRSGFFIYGGGMNQMEYTFGIGYDLLKVTKAVMEEDDDTFINGEIGEEINFWDDGYFDNAEMEGVPV